MSKDLFLITGASTGIGYALAERFGALGHEVLAGVRNQKDFDKLKALKNITPLILDVTKTQDIAKVPALLDAKIKSGQRFILVNNAGVAVSGPWELVSETDFRRQLETNVIGPITLTQQCLPILRRTQGHVFNVSSVAGLFATPYMGPYSVSKYALEAFSDSLRREMFSFGVQVTSINPGPIQTPIWDKGLKDPRLDAFQKDPIYGGILTKFEKNVKKVIDQAIDVKYVVATVEKAYLSSSPPARKIVSDMGTKWTIRVSRLLPTKMVDKMLRRF